MPRFLSAVTFRASSLPSVWTHTCRTFFSSGAIKERYLPSGEISGDVLTGLPKITFRGMSVGKSALAGITRSVTNQAEKSVRIIPSPLPFVSGAIRLNSEQEQRHESYSLASLLYFRAGSKP